jgi:hypothetical protein
MITQTLSKRVTALLVAATLVLAALVPIIVNRQVSAAQLSSRQIRITSSVVGATSVTYNVSFIPSAATAIEGIVIDICQNSPLIGAACTKTNGIDVTPDSPTTIVVSQTGATPASETFNVHANSDTDGLIILTHSSGITTASTVNPITFSFTATNPSGTISTSGAPGTFYARMLTYSDETVADDYVSATPGTHTDDGGVALSTARQLTVSARVQEQLEFCVGAIPGSVDTDAEAYANCAAFPTETAVNLGVVDSTTSVATPITGTDPGYDRNGGILIRTNAAGGATVAYYAEQNNSSGSLKVAGAACGSTALGGSTTDQCFNSAGATQANFQTSVAGEKFGMTAGKVLRPTGSTTTALTRDTDYDGNGVVDNSGACAAGTIDSPNCFSWVDTQPAANTPAETLASSSGVLDYEMLVLNFAARAAATTPTGAYSVTSTYIATAVF